MRTLSARQIYLILFLQGFASLSLEILTLRLLTPHFGSAITITAPIIGFYLIALSGGYYYGVRKRLGQKQISFIMLGTALCAGTVLTSTGIELLAGTLKSFNWLFVIVVAVLMLCGFLLSAAFSALTLDLTQESALKNLGPSLFWSTVGSALSCLVLSLVLMPLVGLWAAVFVTSLSLLCAYCVLQTKFLSWGVFVVLLPTGYMAYQGAQRIETAYADYRISRSIKGKNTYEILWANGQVASLTKSREGEPNKSYAEYVDAFKKFILQDLNLKNKEILIVGAGGFTASEGDLENKYTYVDIDPKIKSIAETHYLKKAINGRFVARDARQYVKTATERFDVIMSDTFTDGKIKVPDTLSTQEYWSDVNKLLQPEGFLYVNVVVDPKLQSDYTRRFLATLYSIFGPCEVHMINRNSTWPNLAVICRKFDFSTSKEASTPIYLDEKNPQVFDSISE